MSGNLVLTVSTIPQGWGSIVAPSFTSGVASNWSFAPYVPPLSSNYIIGTSGQTGVVNSTKIQELAAKGVILDSVNKQLVYDGTVTTGNVLSVILEDVSSPNAEQDFLNRVSGAGVVWYNGMKTSTEVDAFRWINSYGNSPQGLGSGGSNVRWLSTDGGCMEIIHPIGSLDGHHWWRPFSPLTAPGNGKTTNDPGARGTVSVRTWSPTEVGTQTSSFTNGWYTHPSVTGSNIDGNEFYLQMRVMRDINRISGANAGIEDGGKFSFLTTCPNSLTLQELVTVSGDSAFRVYGGWQQFQFLNLAPGSTGTIQPGGAAPIWFWGMNGTWDTIMYHVIPGRPGVSETLFEVYGAHSGETSFTKFWSQTFSMGGYDFVNGWQALILTTYNNGDVFPVQFYERIREVIFSKQFIPCPLV